MFVFIEYLLRNMCHITDWKVISGANVFNGVKSIIKVIAKMLRAISFKHLMSILYALFYEIFTDLGCHTIIAIFHFTIKKSEA